MVTLTPEEKNARMGQERTFLASLLESALRGQGDKLVALTETYAKEHHWTNEEVLSQCKDAQKRTALHFACRSPANITEKDILQTLLLNNWLSTNAAETIVRQKDQDGLTPLMMAAQHSNTAIGETRVAILLQVGGSKLALGRSNIGATALHYAAGAGATHNTIHLLAQAATIAVTTTSQKGGTPLHWAAALQGDYTATLTALMECGANIESHNEQGLTPLMLAAAAGNDVHSKWFVQAGASPTSVLPGNVTIYHIAADLNLVGTLAELLEKYPDTSQQDIQRTNDAVETPLDLACQENHIGCVMLLKGYNDIDMAKQFMEEHKSKLGLRKDKISPTVTNDQSLPDMENPTERDAKQRAADILKQVISEESKIMSLELKGQGNQHFLNKEWLQAINYYSQAIELDPSNETFYSNRSAAFLPLGEKEKALSDAMVCTVLKKDWAKGFYRLAMARMEVGRYEDAAVSAWDGLQLDQQNDELKRLLQKCVKRGRKEHFDNGKKIGERQDKR